MGRKLLISCECDGNAMPGRTASSLKSLMMGSTWITFLRSLMWQKYSIFQNFDNIFIGVWLPYSPYWRSSPGGSSPYLGPGISPAEHTWQTHSLKWSLASPVRASVVYNFGQLVNFSGNNACCKFELYKLSLSIDYLHFDKVGESKLSER